VPNISVDKGKKNSSPGQEEIFPAKAIVDFNIREEGRITEFPGHLPENDVFALTSISTAVYLPSVSPCCELSHNHLAADVRSHARDKSSAGIPFQEPCTGQKCLTHTLSPSKYTFLST
jgi:hypothetical protein